MKAKRRTITIDLNYKREYFEKLEREGWQIVNPHISDNRLPPGFASEILDVIWLDTVKLSKGIPKEECKGRYRFYKRTPAYIVFDNEGDSFDRYTVINEDGDMLGLSDNPTHPQGFSQFCGNCVDNYVDYSYGGSWRRHLNVPKIIQHELPRIIKEFEAEGHLGKRVEFVDLPKDIQEHIKYRFETIN